MDNQRNYARALKCMGLFGSVQGLGILLSVIRNKVAAVLIGTVGFGLVDLYNRTLELLGNASNLGLPFSAIRNVSTCYEEGDDEQLQTCVALVRMWVLLTAMAGMLLCCLLSPLLSRIVFDNADHTSDFCFLSPVVACLTFCGGEMAILKGVRQVKRIATISLSGAVSTLLIVIPCYYVGGLNGIVPALLLCPVVLSLIQFYHGSRVLPWKSTYFRWKNLKHGVDMIKLGSAYILAGVVTTGAELFVRAFIRDYGSMNDVGLYAAAFTLCVTYSRLVFIAMDADYFPRLSACSNEPTKANKVIDDQANVCMLLIAPAVCLFMLFLPLIVRILYSAAFAPSVLMATCAALYMFFKAITMPVAYLSLAKGDSVFFFCMELAYAVFFIIAVAIGYSLAGLTGAGWALSAANLFDFLLIFCCFRSRYAFRFERKTYLRIALQLTFVVLTLMALLNLEGSIRYVAASLFTLPSLLLSYYYLRKELTRRRA